ncbi:MAG: glycerol-3-phosphate dehydrogenase [Alphaproteobacteria bacterium]|nr:glycerol-3-phosphate dehydrogenase [Alphaproteobacteria bacterium]
MATRQAMWEKVGPRVDLLVIGGGVTGCGIARDAARRGLDVLVVEMHDLAFGTSSRSSKLVHGGLRYLEQGELSLVFEAVSERRILLDIAPHLVQPLGFLFPVFKGSRQPLWMINTGMWLYDGLSLFRSPKLHRTLTSDDVGREEPQLRNQDLVGAPLYYDCATDDARLTLENALDATRAGAVVVPRAKVTGLVHGEGGRITAVQITDVRTGEVKVVEASAVVNATGPWTDATVTLGAAPDKPLLRPTKGVHLVVDHHRLPVRHAVVCFHPTDGRVLFAIPWGEQTYVGTTDTDYFGDPAEVAATREDVTYLLEAANAYFPEAHLVPEDVLSTWAGLRPLMRPVSGDDVDESAVSREHQIVVGHDGLITIAGGKLTTYRRMSAEVVDTVVKLLRLARRLPPSLVDPHTDREPLPGAVGWPEDDDTSRLVARTRELSGDVIAEASARHLVRCYGTRALDLARRIRTAPELAAPLVPGRPEVLGQVDWSVLEELASDVDDVLVRRTQLFYRDADQGLGCAQAVGERIGALLGWDEARVAQSVQGYRDVVALARRWQQEEATAAAEAQAAIPTP